MTAPDPTAADSAADPNPSAEGGRLGPRTSWPQVTVPGDQEWVRAKPPASGIRRDAVVAICLLVGSVISVLLLETILAATPAPSGPPLWTKLVWAFAISAPLAVRRLYPATVAIVASAAFMIGNQLGSGEPLFSNICLYLAIYTVGAWSQNRRRALVIRGVIVVAMFVWLLTSLIMNSNNPETTAYLTDGGGQGRAYFALSVFQVIINILYFAAAIYFGSSAYVGARRQFELERRTEELHNEREQNKRQAVALERVRIARELHDVVAHHVSVMGLQAGAARRVLSKLSDREDDQAIAKTGAALSAIEVNARSAVDELHRMLTTLRQSDDSQQDDATESASTRGVAQLHELVEAARSTGMPTELREIGVPTALPVTVGFTVYRIVQESLTNCRKHGGPSVTVQVRLRYLDGAVEIEVSDDGVGRRQSLSSQPNGGLGQTGMRERVAAVGGTITVGPKPRGGYLVRAWLPVPVTAEQDGTHSENVSAEASADSTGPALPVEEGHPL